MAVICLLQPQHVSAFTTTTATLHAPSATTSTSLDATTSRRSLLTTVTTSSVATGIALLGFDKSAAFADDAAVDDLAMPSAEEQAAAEVSSCFCR